MSKCYLNGKEYEINEKIIRDYIDSFDNDFTAEDKDKIVNKVCDIMDGREVGRDEIQEFNFIEDAYTDAVCMYVFNKSLEELLDEKDDAKVIEYMGFGKESPCEERD